MKFFAGASTGCARLILASALVSAISFPLSLHAQKKVAPAKSDPAEALSATLTAACKRDEPAFALRLTDETAAAFRKLPEKQRATLMGRLAMLNAAGKVLLSSGSAGQPIVRCDAAGTFTELRFGAPEVQENLAFISVDAHAGDDSRSVRFGLVRETGEWRLISVGLLMLDLPAMAQQWAEEDLRAGEVAAVASLHKIAEALEIYRRGFDHLPESLNQLGPAGPDGISPDHSSLLDAALAAGESGGYRFRYVIVPAASSGSGNEAEQDKAAGFALAATPAQYGPAGHRSFYLDSAGILRGADKHGAVATSNDPEIDEPRL